MVQWLGPCALTKGPGSIPGQRTKIPQVAWCVQKKKKRNKKQKEGFPGGSVVKHLPANAGDTGSSPGPGRSHMPQSN